ncbi:peroxisome biogenesis protein 3-2-like isoform X2 [Cynara cardunculus var. scolymus]|uniref:peroxisome biogenesis protein 3-2-like isoform X2 n=1 Tax=Cynara cardunculus var. scolymus TaxID=59895 RepID=UPI000D629E5E|nr:peroxisome biogenesis protein 3-2-like isoform X2 [Cynara cardunculus var. scolymus]
MWEFWRRHKRKVYVSLGLCGSGYLLYKFYDAYTKRISELERQLADEQENDELLKAQMQVHFENIQRIANTMTLPNAMLYLSSRVAEELDLLHLTERLIKGKGQPNSLTPSEKLELWDRLKILSFTRMVLSIWAMTAISLYIRIQVNILGRHLYIDTARDLGGFQPEDADLIERTDEQQFLASADFLSSHRIPALISNMQAAATEVLRGKQLRDIFNSTVLHETIMQILNMFMSTGRPHHWVDYLMPEDVRFYKSVESSGSDSPNVSDVTKLDLLMVETRTVLSSLEMAIYRVGYRWPNFFHGLHRLVHSCSRNQAATSLLTSFKTYLKLKFSSLYSTQTCHKSGEHFLFLYHYDYFFSA